jgi:aspartate aminotransferase
MLPNSGTDDLKRAIVERMRADDGVEYSTSEVIVTAGGKQALYNSVLALFGPGDEVITHMPGWPTMVEQIKLADATPVIVRTHAEDGFKLTADLLLNAVTQRTRGIIINSPGNPTGALMSDADMETVAREAARRGIWCCSISATTVVATTCRTTSSAWPRSTCAIARSSAGRRRRPTR